MSAGTTAHGQAQASMAEKIRLHDWASTELGPMESWPEALRQTVRLALAAKEPMMVLWGPRHLRIFNDAFAALPAVVDGETLGEPLAEVAPAVWQALRADLELCLSGEGVLRENRRLPLASADTFWTYGLVPIHVDDEGTTPPGGALLRASETTAAVQARLRLETMIAALERLPSAESSGAALRILLEAAMRIAGADAAGHWSGADRRTQYLACDPETGEPALSGEMPDESIVGAIAASAVRAKAEGATVVDTGSRAGGLASLVAVPVAPQAPGVVIVAWKRRIEPDEAVIAALEALARACGAAIVRSDSERRLRESEARFRSIAQLSPESIFVLLEGVTVFANGAAAHLVGARSTADCIGLPIETLLADDDLRARTQARIARVVEGGETLPPREQIWRRLDGALVTVEVTAGPVDWNGREAVQVLARDVGERKLSEAALAASEARFRESERRLRQTMENLPQLVWRARDGGDWTWASTQWQTFTGQSRVESLGFGWLDAIHAEDRERVRAAWADASGTGLMEVEHRVRDASGQWRWFQSRARALIDDRGMPLEWFGATTDVDDLRRLQEHQKVLLAEIQHRVRNTLAIVRSIARRTADTAETVSDFASHFEGRLNAFARVQAQATRNPIASLDLEYLIAEELSACAVREDERVSIEGPPVKLRLKAAQSLTLAIHELATNAVKFGAFANSGGRLAVSWRVEERDEGPPIVELAWVESGVSIDPQAPRRQGFGSELLLRSLPYELAARVSLDFHHDGVRCTIALPLGERAAQ